MATRTKDRRDRWFLEELLEPEDGHLTPLAATVAAVFAVVGFVTERFIDSTLEDREALHTRHRWEMRRRQQRNQQTQDQLRGDEHDEPGATDEDATDDHVPTYDRSETSINPDAEPENRATDPAPAADVVDGEVIADGDIDLGREAGGSPVSTTEVEKRTDRHREANESPVAAPAHGGAVVEVEHPDAAAAVAAAAEAVAQANGLDPRHPVIVVAAEDVPVRVAEDSEI